MATPIRSCRSGPTKAGPPGPLNYIQIEDLIAFIRAPSNETFTIRDPALNEPKLDPITDEVKTFNGWVDVNYKPAPGATPFPACWSDEFNTRVGRAGRVGCTGRLGWGLGRAGAFGRGLSAAAVGRSIGVARGLGWRRRCEGLHRGVGDRLADV